VNKVHVRLIGGRGDFGTFSFEIVNKKYTFNLSFSLCCRPYSLFSVVKWKDGLQVKGMD
jgi:hypothetical protein